MATFYTRADPLGRASGWRPDVPEERLYTIYELCWSSMRDSDRAKARGSTRATVSELGRLIVAGETSYRPDQVLSIEKVTEETGVSRAMAREVLQVLHQKRLVELQPRLGARVRRVQEWDV